MKSVITTDVSKPVPKPKDSAKLGSIRTLLNIAKQMEMEDAKSFKAKKKGAPVKVEVETNEGAC